MAIPSITLTLFSVRLFQEFFCKVLGHAFFEKLMTYANYALANALVLKRKYNPEKGQNGNIGKIFNCH